MTASLVRSYPKRGGDLLYVPQPAHIIRTKQLTALERMLEIRFADGQDLGHRPGQFVQVSVFGYGEAPISICSSPAKKGSFEMTVRNMGGLTAALHRAKEGDTIGIRGPFGTGFPMGCMQKMDCLMVAGGIGMAPLRSVIDTVLADRDRYGRLIVLYGSGPRAISCSPTRSKAGRLTSATRSWWRWTGKRRDGAGMWAWSRRCSRR